MEGYRFCVPIRVRWSEVDAQQVVFHAHYLTYLDCANSDYLRRAVSSADRQLDLLNLVVKRTTLEYHSPARFDDELVVWCRVTKLGRSSLTFTFVITRGDSEGHLLTAETVYVYVDPAAGKPARIPDEWRSRIRAFEGTVL